MNSCLCTHEHTRTVRDFIIHFAHVFALCTGTALSSLASRGFDQWRVRSGPGRTNGDPEMAVTETAVTKKAVTKMAVTKKAVTKAGLAYGQVRDAFTL